MGQYAVTIVVAALLVAVVIYQQMRTRPVNPRQQVAVPLVLALLGLFNLQHHPLTSEAAGVALAASVVTGLLFGLARGVTTQTWWSNGVLLRKGTVLTLLLWVAGIGLRLIIGVVAQREGVPVSVTSGELPLFLGVTLGAQNLLIWYRGQQAPIPRSETAV
jgi:hypothetical protein